jgi:hypothetical protein
VWIRGREWLTVVVKEAYDLKNWPFDVQVRGWRLG